MRMDVRMNWDEFNREIRADFPALQRVIESLRDDAALAEFARQG